MLKQMLAFAAEYDMLPSQGTVVVAVSGGRDSMVLLHLLRQAQGELAFTLHACHFNHQLRGAESREDQAFVEKACERLGVPLTVGQGDVRSRAVATGESVEEAARVLRYAFFEDTVEALGANRLATAHHADDNGETLLINLVRGAGLQGLTGIPPRRDYVVRPLLTISHADIRAWAERHRVAYRQDSSNERRDFLRNRLRHEVMPILREENPQLAKSMSKTARLLRSDNDYLNARSYELFQQARPAQDNYVIEARYLALTPDAVATRAVRRIFEAMGEQVPAARLEDILALARGEDPSAVLHVGGDLLVQRVYDDVLFTVSSESLSPFEPVALNLNGATDLSRAGWMVDCRADVCPTQREPGICYLKSCLSEGEPVLRSRAMGDAITLRQGSGRKTLKKLFIDEKVPRFLREVVPVLALEDQVVAVGTFGADVAFHAAAGEACYRVAMRRTDPTMGLIK